MLNRYKKQRLVHILRNCSFPRADEEPMTVWDTLALATFHSLPRPEMQRFMRLVFFNHLPTADVCQTLNIKRSTFYVWRQDILFAFYTHILQRRESKWGNGVTLKSFAPQLESSCTGQEQEDEELHS